ncbi:unnamed protein product [Schistosoma rodhaini]|uniref:Uncharacterized protein n=1 Tax=Schistosoma rodhaini TaxID=6188 RepID=A0AA85GAK8_9TREM|nr:unnamed protein product [Schistosoma rodhaini]
MSSLISHWKRFISACSTPATSVGIGGSGSYLASNSSGSGSSGVTPAPQNSFQKSPVEWECLNETVNLLLKTCPVSRSAILDHLAPLYIDYFVTWWHVNSGTATNRNVNIESQNLHRAEVVLQELLKTINSLITYKGVTDHLLGAVCSWCLVLIRPVCTAPPTQLLSNLMDLLGSRSRQQSDGKSSLTLGRTLNNSVMSTSRKILHKSGIHNIASTDDNIHDRDRLNVIKGTICRYGKKRRSDLRSLSSSSSTSTPYHRLIIMSDSDSYSISSSDEENELVEVGGVDVAGNVKRNNGTLPSANICSNTSDASELKSLSTNSDNRDQSDDNKLNSIGCNTRNIGSNSNDQIFSSLKKHDCNSIGGNTIDLDFGSTSAVNQQILGLWVKCPVLIDLLNIVCNCLLCSDIRLSSVQALLASSTVPIWDSSLESSKHCHSLANSVLPHWIVIWLLYQATGRNNLSTGIQKLNELCSLILTSILHPFRPNVLQCTLLPDTLGGYFYQSNFDLDFWITVCLTHLLFLGDSVPEFLGDWLRTKLEPLSVYALLISNEASLDNDNINKQNPLTQQTRLLNLIFNLSLISVPIPPHSPSEQQILVNNALSTTELTMDHQPWRYSYLPKGFIYGITPSSCRPPCVLKEMDCKPIPSHFGVPPMPLRNMNPMLPTPCHLPLPLNNMLNSNLPTGQSNFTPLRPNFSQQFEIPVRRPPPLLQVPVNIPSNRPTLNDSHPMLTGAVLLFSERQSNNYLAASRQPTSLLWILSLVRRIRSVTLSVVIDNFITLTPFQLFALFRNQHEFTYQSATRMIELLVKSILQAPVGSNVERLLIYLINICESEQPQLSSTSTFSVISTTTSTTSSAVEKVCCSDAKKPKLNSDDQLSQRNQSLLEYHKFFNSFLSYCREILRILCDTTIFLTYSSSETADSLDRGGCEGLLRAALRLSNPPPLSLSYKKINITTTTNITDNTITVSNDEWNCKFSPFSNSKYYLFQKLVSANSLQNSLCAQLILSLGFTLDPSLIEYLLFYLCCWRCVKTKTNSNENSFTSRASVKSAKSSSFAQLTFCPLMLFFPLLNEIQFIWVARTSSRPLPLTATTASTTTGTLTIPPVQLTDALITDILRPSIFPTVSIRNKYLLMSSHQMDSTNNNNASLSFLYPNGLLYIHQLLANKYFPLLWSSLDKGDHEFRISVLRNLLWLVNKELILIGKNSGQPRILFALGAQLGEIVNMMLKNDDLQCLDLLLSLCECIFCTFRFPPTNRLSPPTTTTTLNQSMKLSESSHYYHLTRFRDGLKNSGVLNTNGHLRYHYGSHQTFGLILLSPTQCMQLANSFVQLTSRLMFIMNDANLPSESSSLSSCTHLYVFGRFRNLLNLLFSTIQSTIFRSAIMRLIPKVIMSSRLNPYTDDLLKNNMPTMDYFNANLFDSNLSYLLPNCFINTRRNNTRISSQIYNDNSMVLTNNPPKKIDHLSDDQDDLIRGQLKPRINNDNNNTVFNNFVTQNAFRSTQILTHRGPGESSLELGYHSTKDRMLITSNNDEQHATNYQLSSWLHWLNFIRFIIIDDIHLYHLCNVESRNFSICSNGIPTKYQLINCSSLQLQQTNLVNNHQLISGLEDVIQGAGIHLPQTSIKSLSFQSLNFVLPPSGVSLERVLSILSFFCPEVKQIMSGNNYNNLSTVLANASSSNNSKLPINPRNKLVQLSSQGILELSTVLSKINLKTYGLPPLYHPLPVYASYFTESTVLNFLDPISLLSTPKIILGLLMGLEAVWASPLAPRISIPMGIKFLTKRDNGTYVEQAFPMPGASDVCKTHARKISVDYAYRRLDTNSTMFKFTSKLLFCLMEVCCLQDCLEKIQQQEQTNKKSCVSDRSSREQLQEVDKIRQQNFLITQWCSPLNCLLHCLAPREFAILISDIRRNLRLRIAFYHIKQQKAIDMLYPKSTDVVSDQLPLALMLNPLPPTPAFITPGLLIALIQAHLMEDGIADCLGPLIHSMEVLTQCPAATKQRLADEHKKPYYNSSTNRPSEKQSLGNSKISKADDSGLVNADNGDKEDIIEEQDTIFEEINVNGEEFVIVK